MNYIYLIWDRGKFLTQNEVANEKSLRSADVYKKVIFIFFRDSAKLLSSVDYIDRYLGREREREKEKLKPMSYRIYKSRQKSKKRIHILYLVPMTARNSYLCGVLMVKLAGGFAERIHVRHPDIGASRGWQAGSRYPGLRNRLGRTSRARREPVQV